MASIDPATPLRSRPASYVIAATSAGAAMLIRWALDPVFGDGFPFITLYGAVAFTVWITGWRPACSPC